MADGRGGYRKPSSPAPVSGPGSLSQRTDNGQPARWISGDQYGEGKEMMELQTSAQMSKAAPTPRPAMATPAGNGTPAEFVPLFAPTQRPNEPVTASVPMPVEPARVSLAEKLYAALGEDMSGDIDEIASIAMRYGL